MYYGLISKNQAVEIAKAVCDTIGHGSGHAFDMIMETACAETHLGEYRDPTPHSAGTGLTQVDKSTFEWLKEKASTELQQKLLDTFGFDIKQVNLLELELSPLLAFVFCRLRYAVVTAPIPAERGARAAYWKKYYNSSRGKGDIAHYLDTCKALPY